MKYIYFTLFAFLFTACNTIGDTKENSTPNDNSTTTTVLPEGEFTYNLPCKVIYINPDKPGKAILWLWLHGGVHDRPKHDIFMHPNHFDCCDADELIVQYLKESDTKAIALMPVCYKANLTNTIRWSDCFDDVKHMIDDYATKGLIDTNRVYVTGSSDGGRGAWDYAELHPEIFAAAIAMSCAQPRKVDIPMYFFGTKDEKDCTEEVNELIKQGVNVKYKYCSEVEHGGDAAECTPTLLKEFFSHTK